LGYDDLLKRAGRFVAFSILALSVCPVAGQDRQSQQPPPTAPPPKEQPPPLFPRHRRGIYRDRQGLEVVDPTPQSPPLETDDPGVPDKGEFEINFTTHANLSKDAPRVDLLLVDANYGILPKIAGHELPTQVKFEFPLAAASTNGDPFRFGTGAARFGLKFNFYINEQHGVSISFYPQVEFATPGGGGVEKGLAERGQTLIVPLLVSKEFHYFTFVANGAVEKSVHDPAHDIAGILSVAFGRAITRTFAAMVEVRGESAFDNAGDRLMFLNVGLIRGLRNVVVYAKVGHSLASSDDVSHTYVGVGMKLLIQAQKKK
jgi:hypothetical protein